MFLLDEIYIFVEQPNTLKSHCYMYIIYIYCRCYFKLHDDKLHEVYIICNFTQPLVTVIEFQGHSSIVKLKLEVVFFTSSPNKYKFMSFSVVIFYCKCVVPMLISSLLLWFGCLLNVAEVLFSL